MARAVCVFVHTSACVYMLECTQKVTIYSRGNACKREFIYACDYVCSLSTESSAAGRIGGRPGYLIGGRVSLCSGGFRGFLHLGPVASTYAPSTPSDRISPHLI